MENKILEVLLELQKDIKEVKNELADVKTKLEDVQTELSDVKETVHRIELTQNEDVIALLKVTTKKVAEVEEDVQFLAGKVGKHEMKLNRFEQN